VSNLKTRIERIEKRLAVDESPLVTLEELVHYVQLQDPAGFRRKATDPNCRDSLMKQVLDQPPPKRILRLFRRVQLGLTAFPSSCSDDNCDPRHTEADLSRGPGSPKENSGYGLRRHLKPK
jgi:hypothetical protein